MNVVTSLRRFLDLSCTVCRQASARHPALESADFRVALQREERLCSLLLSSAARDSALAFTLGCG